MERRPGRRSIGFQLPRSAWVSAVQGPSAGSIGPREDHPPGGRLTRDHALSRLLRTVERDATDRRLGLFLNLVLRGPRPVPVGPNEARLLDQLFELVVALRRPHVRVAELLRPL